MSKGRVANYFEFKELKTDFKTEILAGLAVFLSVVYIAIVNPAILSDAGMPFAGVMTATIIVGMIFSVLMGLVAKVPIVGFPGMGINAFFAYFLVGQMGLSWQTALGATFISGIIFVILSVLKVRRKVVDAIPKSVRMGVAAGIGLFLAFIGLQSVGFVVPNAATMVAFGRLDANFVYFMIGVIIISVLLIKKIKGAVIIGIVGTTVIAALTSKAVFGVALVPRPEAIFAWPSFSVFFKLDIIGALKVGLIAPIFTLLFADMMDSVGTFTGIAEVSGLYDKDGQPKNVGRCLLVDAIGTTISGLFGTSSATSYAECTIGVEEGGRSGFLSIVVALCFIPVLFFSPLFAVIPAAATAGALFLVGVFLVIPVKSIEWTNWEESIPAFAAMILMPLTYSITIGLVFGFILFTVLKILRGKFKEIKLATWIITAISILALFFLQSPPA